MRLILTCFLLSLTGCATNCFMLKDRRPVPEGYYDCEKIDEEQCMKSNNSEVQKNMIAGEK